MATQKPVMSKLPPDLYEDFSEKGETFYTIAEVVLTNHGRQQTAEEIAERAGPGKEGFQQYLPKLEEKSV